MPNLTPNIEYDFRVCGENGAGKGDYATTTKPIMCQEKVPVPSKPLVTDVGKTQISIAWTIAEQQTRGSTSEITGDYYASVPLILL